VTPDGDGNLPASLTDRLYLKASSLTDFDGTSWSGGARGKTAEYKPLAGKPIEDRLRYGLPTEHADVSVTLELATPFDAAVKAPGSPQASMPVLAPYLCTGIDGCWAGNINDPSESDANLISFTPSYERFRVHKTVFPQDFLADFGFRTLRAAGRVSLSRLELGGLQPVAEGTREKVLRVVKEAFGVPEPVAAPRQRAYAAPSSAGFLARARSALREHTRRICSTTASAASGGSYATGPGARAGEPGHERSCGPFVPGERPGLWPGAACKARGVGAQRRPLHRSVAAGRLPARLAQVLA